MIHRLVDQIEQKFTDSIGEVCNDIKNAKFLKNFQNDNLNEEIQNIIIPHVLYQPLNQILDVFKFVFENLKKEKEGKNLL